MNKMREQLLLFTSNLVLLRWHASDWLRRKSQNRQDRSAEAMRLQVKSELLRQKSYPGLGLACGFGPSDN
jgi:hypothetical protein